MRPTSSSAWLPDEDPWPARAACQYTDPEIFFPVGTGEWHETQAAHARQICCVCPVQVACLSWALTRGEPEGIWGGSTPAERRLMRDEIFSPVSPDAGSRLRDSTPGVDRNGSSC